MGFEPTSKQGIPKFSTCLSCNWFSMRIRSQATKLHTYHMFFSLWLCESSLAISLSRSPIVKYQEQGSCTGLACYDLSAAIRRNRTWRLGCKRICCVVISDLPFQIKEPHCKTLCMLAQLFILLSNPRSGPVEDLLIYWLIDFLIWWLAKSHISCILSQIFFQRTMGESR